MYDSVKHTKERMYKMARQKLTLETVKERLRSINPYIEILSKEYVSSKTRLRCRCLIDGNEWNVVWGSLQQGYGCPVCGVKLANDKKRLNIDKVKKELNKINPDIEILSKEYVNSHTKLSCKCLKDGHEWMVKWGHLQQGRGCPKCAGKTKLTMSVIKDRLKDINPNVEILNDAYFGAGSRLKCRCLIDGYEWNTTWNDLQKKKNVCLKCKALNWDHEIESFLISDVFVE